MNATAQPLQAWADKNDPSKTNLIWKDGFWDQIIFVRDMIPGLAYSAYDHDYAITDGIVKSIGVISTHTSKSLLLPVYHMTMPNGDVFVMRYNFYDWKVSVNSDSEFAADFMDLFDSTAEIHDCYCEGFPTEWVYGSYAANKKQFTIELRSGMYEIYVFFRIYFNKIVSHRKFKLAA